jgi:hypothetical protein
VTQIFVLKNDKRRWEQDLHKKASDLGAQQAASSRPMADSADADEGENKVRTEVYNRELGVHGLLSNELNRLAPLLANESAEVNACHVSYQQRRSPSGSKSYCEGVFAQRKAQLVEAYFDRYRSEAHYNRFRHQHGITKDPDHPEDKLNYLSWLFLILAAETVLNSVFWTQSLEGFVTKALLISFVLSALNIVIGFLAGAGFGHKNLRDPGRQIFGWGSLLVGIALGCLINYFIITNRPAHSGVADASGDHSIDSILSLAMFAIGESFSLFAIFKGYRFFGSVPGYEAASHQFLAARKRINDLFAELKDAIHKEKREQEDVRRSLLRKVSDVQNRLAKLKADIQNVRAQYTLAMDSLHAILEQCVKAYRSAYRAVKPVNSSTPAWFDQLIARSPLRDESLASTETQFRSQEEQVEELARTLRDDFAQEFSALEEMATLYLGERLTELTNGADGEGLRKYEESVNSTVDPTLVPAGAR